MSPRRIQHFSTLMRSHGSALVCVLLLFFAGAESSSANTAEVSSPVVAQDPQSPELAELPGATEGFVDSGGVKIHYVTMGNGPLLVMIHGFPDYWYSWRKQMPALAEHFQVVAVDQRGYNLSDKPEGVSEYAMPKLVGDLVAVVEHFPQERATIVGHDWGGAVAWQFAMSVPQLTERLVILNLPHPNGLRRELANNPQQQANSQYARDFQAEDAASKLDAKQLAGWVTDADARSYYVAAFQRSSFKGMLNYYKANYPRQTGNANTAADPTPSPKVKCPVLMFHGLEDQALLPSGLNNTWEWVENDLTIMTIPGAGHFVQQDAGDKVTKHMVRWLTTD
ncbi:MAG: alpha/beta hydrolase [Pirellulales bacterium]|nr:alpha/beta hydrolase [Pirellulales bacterium]